MKHKDTIIVGGGLSGLSSGVELVRAGKKVLLLESRDILGGRTSSWIEKGMLVESGLHRVLGFYVHFPELIKKAGLSMKDVVIWEDELEFRLPGGASGVYGAAPFFKPFKSLRWLFGNNHILTIPDKLTLTKFLTKGLMDYYSNPEELDRYSVLDYAKENGVSDKTIQRLLIPLTAGIFFLPPERYSAFVLFGLIAFSLPNFHKTRAGAFKGGMTDVLAEPLGAYIKNNGGEIRTSTEVKELIVENERVVGVKTTKEKLYADHVILATTLDKAQILLKKPFSNHPWFHDMLSLQTIPTVTLQLELKTPAMKVDHTTFGPGTCWASFAEQSRTTFTHAKGRLSIILTPPEKFIKMDEKAIYTTVVADGKRLGIDLTDKVVQYRVTRQYADFYSLTPGNEKLKPAQKTPIGGLVLAGDYTKQQYLATMEGAVFSGKTAALAVIS